MRKFFLRLLLAAYATGALSAAEPAVSQSPPATLQNSFCIFAIWDGIMGAPEAKIREQMDRLKTQFGTGNRYHRTGFAFIKPGKEQLRLICRLAKEKGLNIGVITGEQTHSNGGFKKAFAQDLRCYQWRANGKNWQGYYVGKNDAGKVEVSENSRDHLVPTPSRYCKLVRDYLFARDRTKARELHEVMTEFPGVIMVVNGVIEEELAIAAASMKGPDAEGYLADYSPFAVTEFRDWLRHTGLYDADTGACAGQGAPEAIVGPFAVIKGKKRSPFYDDPNPGYAYGGGKSFNDSFGTFFTTWKLRYWDLEAFPEPITDQNFDPSPQSGRGFVEGGFDPPRLRNKSAWWSAWSWENDDHGKKFPPGYPQKAAYGFRQVLVANFVRDTFDEFAKEGLSRELMFAHQIPGERMGGRALSSASTIWSGWLPKSGTVGVTQFGRVDPAQITPLAPRWGIFEWHPLPNSKPDEQKLYDTATRDLLAYYNSGCCALFAGWWLNDLKANARTIFPLDDSNFARAIHDFLAARPDEPRTLRR